MSPRGAGSRSRARRRESPAKNRDRNAKRLARRKKAKRSNLISAFSATVLNDAGIELTKDQMQVLTLGRNFCATPKIPETIDNYVNKLLRKINLQYFFFNKPEGKYRRSLLAEIVPSDWTPPDLAVTDDDPVWQQFCNQINPKRDDLIDACTINHRNLPKNLETAWASLANHETTYIINADKGGMTVIFNKKDYRKEALRQLFDKSTYKQLTFTEIRKEISRSISLSNNLLDRLIDEDNITRVEADRAKNTIAKAKIPPIYFLPKVHKEKRADTGTFPMRPIISACCGPTKVLDEYIAKITAPLLKCIPGSICDTTELISKLQKFADLPSEAKLFSADVESLYPSIDWYEGTMAAGNFYRQQFRLLQKCINQT